MPVGTSFENSAMKASFSLSSLQATECTPERKEAVKPRLYNSLTKNRVKATAVRRSWGSTASDHREEFWSALQANYNFIMDNQLIDKCQEANGDLSLETSIGTWTLKEFYAQFSELYSWLNSVQETIYGKEENITDKALRARCTEMVNEKSSSLKLFNDQASQVVQLYPEVLEEVDWRVTHLNSKWDTILSILGPSECEHCDQETCLDIDHEIKCLKKWFKTMEAALQPLDFRTKYTKTEIETKALELKVLHRDIENHGKIVSSVVKLCKRSDASCNTVNVRRNANGLERRWHLLFLRSLEWQCYLESLSKRGNLRNRSSSSSESDDSDYYEGPVNKYPRLSGKEYQSSDNINADSVENDSSDWEQREKSPQPVISDNGMNINTQPGSLLNGNTTADGSFASLSEDISDFTKSNRKAPNCGTYYFKHEDTDSDMDKVDRSNQMAVEEEEAQNNVEGADTLEETSEEEWTYTKSTVEQVNEDQQSQDSQETDPVLKPKTVPEDKIKRLVQKAEELVSPEKCRKVDRVNALNKMTRVKKWLSLDKPDDSCDASGEDDEKESVTSEEFDESTTTFKANQGCNSQNTSFSELNTADGTPKVLMRQKKYTGSRPWSVSCISQLGQRDSSSMAHEEVASFSISESALHKMNLNTKNLERYDSSNNSGGINGNNSTSSTMEEAVVQMEEKSSPNRRRRLKLKKKSSLISHSRCCSTSSGAKSRNMLFKSGSFSGCSNRTIHNERHTSSDPPSTNICHPGKYETSTTSGPDSDEELNRRISFKLGLKTHYLATELRDISPGKSSSLTTEEQLSSLSEQAWDSYQEKYLSEAYSETHDSDAARKLLEFGEDYRNFIDSQSDWSSTNPDFSPTFRRKAALYNKTVDSDSDAESLRQLFKNSRDQYNYTQDIYKQTLTLGLDKYVVANGISEMISTCDRHIDLLNHIGRSSDDFAMSKADKDAAAELLAIWQQLKANILKMQEYRDLQREILLLKNKLSTIEMPEWDGVIDIGSISDLGKDVDYCEKTLEYLEEYKNKLLLLNVSVHRFVFENKDYNVSSLKGDISDLYRIWDEVHSNVSDRLSQLRPLLQRWETLENRLDQLQGDLRSDEKTLLLLDTALKGGIVTDQTATYVRDVAKLLSETTTTSQGCSIPELFTEGSFSDSGISDEGSEHELGERERRLAAIRRLVRQLEVVLAPDSAARIRMAERLNAAEEELKELQKRCRSLIVRTEAYAVPATLNDVVDSDETKKTKSADDADPEDPESAPTSTSWFRRVMRASLPFQVVIITLLCLACLLEPQCCDNMNNFAMSFSPQLRYVKGPPPI